MQLLTRRIIRAVAITVGVLGFSAVVATPGFARGGIASGVKPYTSGFRVAPFLR
jgi:hypothetical protein